MSPPTTNHVRASLSAIQAFGIDVVYYPRYVNEEPALHRIHDALLISFITQGTARHLIDDAEFRAVAGSVGMTRPGEAHTLVTGKQGIEIFNIFLDPVSHPLPMAPAGLRTTQQILFPRDMSFRTLLNRALHFDVPDPLFLRHCVEMLAHECANPTSCSTGIIESLRRVFVLTCCRAAQASGIQPAQSPERRTPQWVLDLCVFMDQFCRNTITLDALAARYGLSRSYLCRAFKRHVGIPPHEYLLNRRIETAMLSLQSTDEKILSIALSAGFNDLSHFNRSFKARTGQSPSAYRKSAPASP